jgi:hypothetical protein
MDLYINCLIRLHGVVPNYFSTEKTLIIYTSEYERETDIPLFKFLL